MGTAKRRLDPRLVERVAAAIFLEAQGHDGDRISWQRLMWRETRQLYRAMARAAIRVIRGR